MILDAYSDSQFIDFKENNMICDTHKPAYPQVSNDKSMTSTENAEHKKGFGLV